MGSQCGAPKTWPVSWTATISHQVQQEVEIEEADDLGLKPTARHATAERLGQAGHRIEAVVVDVGRRPLRIPITRESQGFPAVGARLVSQGSGAIVNVASVNAFFQPDAGTIDYGAAKAAVVNLTKALAQEFGPRGIHVNAVSPGPVATDLWLGKGGVADTVAKATGVDAETARKNVVASIGGFATGRFTTPEEVATLVVLLASDKTANVTGANYIIDGGLIKTT